MTRSTRRRQEGAATVEAVIMLPVVGLLLTGVLFLAQVHAEASETRALARRCALAHAAGGCQEVPAGCEAVLRGARAERDDQTRQAADSARAGAATSGTLVDELPIIGDALDGLLGTTTTGEARRQVPFSPQMEASARAEDPDAALEAEVGGSFSVLCDPRPQSPAAQARRVMCNWLSCGG